MEEKKQLFEHLKSIKDYWVKTSVESLDENADLIWSDYEEEYHKLQCLLKNDEEKEAYERVLNELIKGVLHSILVMVDGGDDLADKYTVDLIAEKHNKSLKMNGALHEEFYDYLLDVED
ncbi:MULTISPECIES: histidine kinase [Rummeliibacillus]|uniref:histidine kinase n=1 Tax=Rummeliibacillus TaxID=648802 RepID=UPI0011B37913|nr:MULTISPECIES: histidine kinase [Rummeliibacillus]MBO2536954.1 histidine kinase [Rummeliibacillus suwonensis]